METTRVLLVRHGQSRGNAERRFGGHSPTPLISIEHGGLIRVKAFNDTRHLGDLV